MRGCCEIFRRLLCGVALAFVFIPLLCVASGVEVQKVPADARYLVHVDVARAMEAPCGGTFERLWITPLLAGYGANICPEVEWSSKTMGGITFLGDGVYTNHTEQVFIFTPRSTRWLAELRTSLKIKQPVEHRVRFARNGYTVVLTADSVYVSRCNEKLIAALRGATGESSLVKDVVPSKDSYLDIVMDKQFVEVLDFPLAASLTAPVQKVHFSLAEVDEQLRLGLLFKLTASADAVAFKQQTERALRLIQIADSGWGSILSGAEVRSDADAVSIRKSEPVAKGQVPKLYYGLLETLFGVKESAETRK